MALRYDPSQVCQKLRSKEMLLGVDEPDSVEGEGQEDESLFDPYDAVAYWCDCTQTGRGPDGDRVHMGYCSRGTARSCFVSIDSLT